MIEKIDHIGVAVNSIEDTMKLFIDALGIKYEDIEIENIEEQKVKTASIPVGDSRIELLESTDPEGPIAKHIEKFGEGLHHIALEVVDIEDA